MILDRLDIADFANQSYWMIDNDYLKESHSDAFK